MGRPTPQGAYLELASAMWAGTAKFGTCTRCGKQTYTTKKGYCFHAVHVGPVLWRNGKEISGYLPERSCRAASFEFGKGWNKSIPRWWQAR